MIKSKNPGNNEPEVLNIRDTTNLKGFPQGIQFKYSWRRYQQRVVDELKIHLEDKHLHVIAPPGSGKTVLGLEVALRINKPTLILAPTVAIKNQWIQRFCELFLQTDVKPDWISNNIKNPEFLTVTTYQALHAACTNSEIDEEPALDEDCENANEGNTFKVIDVTKIVKQLKAQKVGTIVVDEAHHLKNEWWKSLTAIKDAINPVIVGLTATPPYDVSFVEWQRYITLNGPVDAEISVPELVVENDLCPHQDYIYLSKPTFEEKQQILEQRQKAIKVFEELKNDETLIQAVMNHPIYQTPTENLEWIYSNLECYSSVLIFLQACKKPISEIHLEVIGDKKFKVPVLTLEWLEILLNFYLFGDQGNFRLFEEHQERLTNKLIRNGLLERKTVCLSHNPKVNKFLNTSLSKLKSIDEIVDIEYKTLKDDLRMVILTDYIRKEFLIQGAENRLELNKIGVLPIFEQLRRTNDRNMKLAILSGTLVILPVSALVALKTHAQRFNIDNVLYSTLSYDPGYVVIYISEKLKHDIVHLVTRIFEEGEIHVLVGTKSLLGEGWDAPVINSLILASFVGSYVLSNQMRGRAIRTCRDNAEKTGNIWHLVCVDDSATDGGDDIQLLKRRFRGFVGISYNDENGIENGISRLSLPGTFRDYDISRFNSNMVELAAKRNLLKMKWAEALKNGVVLTEEIKIPFPEEKEYKAVKSMYYYKTIANLFAFLGSGLLAFGESMIQALGRSIRHMRTMEDFLKWLMAVGFVGLIIFGRLFYKTFKLYFKYRDISKDIHQIGEALLGSLIKAGVIQTEYSKLKVQSSVDKFGAIYCHLEGGSTFEKSTFIKSLHEIIGLVDDPRYVIIRKSSFLKIISQRDYHSVPEIIGQNKKNAEYFSRQWSRFVGTCELVYTRTIEGRKILLKSRIDSLSSNFVDKTEKINKWR